MIPESPEFDNPTEGTWVLVASSAVIWPADVREWMGVIGHVHTGFLLRRDDGVGSIGQAVAEAEGFGAQGIHFAEHASDPDQPQAFDALSPLAVACSYQIDLVDSAGRDTFLKLWGGLEANVLPDGQLDLPSQAMDGSAVIASVHRVTDGSEKDPAAIQARWARVTGEGHARILGHPTRYAFNRRAEGTDQWELIDVDWLSIYQMAASANMAVEVNINLLRDLFKVPNERWKPDGLSWLETVKAFWPVNLQDLAASGAPVYIGTDRHNPDMWPDAEFLITVIGLLQDAGIKQDRVVNASVDSWEAWL